MLLLLSSWSGGEFTKRSKKQNDSLSLFPSLQRVSPLPLSPLCIMLTQQPVIQLTAWWSVRWLTLTLLSIANINHITVWDRVSKFCDEGSRSLICTLTSEASPHGMAGGRVNHLMNGDAICTEHWVWISEALTAILAPNVWQQEIENHPQISDDPRHRRTKPWAMLPQTLQKWKCYDALKM